MSIGVPTIIIHNWLRIILQTILEQSTLTKNKESLEIYLATSKKINPRKFSYESEPSGQNNQFMISTIWLGPVVQSWISTNPGLNFNPDFFVKKPSFWIISSFPFRAFNHQIVVKRNSTEFYLKAFRYKIHISLQPWVILT